MKSTTRIWLILGAVLALALAAFAFGHRAPTPVVEAPHRLGADVPTNLRGATLEVTGPAKLGTLAGRTAQTFAWDTYAADLSSGDVTLTAAQAARRRILVTGALTADQAVIVDTSATTLALGTDYEVIPSYTGPYLVYFKAAGGVGQWVPPGVPIHVYWDGSEFQHAPGSLAGGDLNFDVALVSATHALSFTAVAKLPPRFLIAEAYLRVTTTIVGGLTTAGISDTTSGAAGILGGDLTGSVAGLIAGLNPTEYGTVMVPSIGYRAYYATGATLYIGTEQDTAACTAGAVRITIHGWVLP